MADLPRTADVVVVGGGVHGASVAYHLARRRAGRVVLIERKFLASGPTGRSSALVRRFYAMDFLTRTGNASAQRFQRWAEDIGGGEYRLIENRGHTLDYEQRWPPDWRGRRRVSRVVQRYQPPGDIWFEFVSGKYRGTKVHSEPHAVATGSREIWPTASCRMRAASSELTVPSPVTSHASCWRSFRTRRPTADWRAQAASRDETALPSSLSFSGSSSHAPVESCENA